MGEGRSAVAKVLITGGQGFIGSALAEAQLRNGHEVRVLDLQSPPFQGLAAREVLADVDLVAGSVTDGASVENALEGIEIVFHLGAQTLVGPAVRDPLGTFDANVRGTWILLDACRRCGPSAIVVASSDKAYGPSERLPYREDLPLLPASPYESSKAAADVISRAAHLAWGLPVAVTRLANVYGGGDLNFSRLVPELLASTIANRRPGIRSDGSPVRDFLHVRDAVAAYLLLSDAILSGGCLGRAFNAGTGIGTSVGEVIEQVVRLTGDERLLDSLAAGAPVGEIDRQVVDPGLLEASTGWSAAVALGEGLAEALEWYSARPRLCT